MFGWVAKTFKRSGGEMVSLMEAMRLSERYLEAIFNRPPGAKGRFLSRCLTAI